ncbi:hypothetical protein [Pseudomonas matsuisoli]|nr:hypothetical protein [Pseudomonas matsuisoli]
MIAYPDIANLCLTHTPHTEVDMDNENSAPIPDIPAQTKKRIDFLNDADFRIPVTVEEFNRGDEEIIALFERD